MTTEIGTLFGRKAFVISNEVKYALTTSTERLPHHVSSPWIEEVIAAARDLEVECCVKLAALAEKATFLVEVDCICISIRCEAPAIRGGWSSARFIHAPMPRKPEPIHKPE